MRSNSEAKPGTPQIKAFMTNAKSDVATDWTGLLSDPDLAKNLGKLLAVYREASPERRDQTLLEAMQEIKRTSQVPSSATETSTAKPRTQPVPASTVPPFEPDVFSQSWGQDRRRHPRIQCFVAVELRVNDAEAPIWGNLSNTGMGGCQVETAAQVSGGSKVEIGLWIASGKIWVKGLALNGVVSRSTAPGVRIRFAGMDAAGKENLRQFLKYIQDTTKAAKNEATYLQLLK
jgi:hypothetical protein